MLSIKTIKTIYLKSLFNEEERIKFYGILLEYSKAGLDRDKYFKKRHKRYVERKDPRAEIVKDWINKLESGFDLAESLSEWITREEFIILKTASANENAIVLALEKTIKLVQMNLEVNKKIKKVSFTVVLYFFLLPIGVFLIFSMGLIPRVITMLEMNVDDNAYVVNVMAIKSILGYALGLMALGLYVMKRRIVSAPSAFRRKYLDKIIPFSLFRVYQSSKFLVSYSTFMASGLNMSLIFKEFIKMDNHWLSFYVSQMINKHDRGGFTTAEVLKTMNFFDTDVQDKLDDYAEANKLETEVELVGDSLIKELIEKLDSINTQATFFGKMVFLIVTVILLGGLMMMITATS